MEEWKHKVVDTSTNITTIINVPALLRGVYINTALSAHTVSMDDGTTTDVMVIPASATAGNYYDVEGLRFETSLIVNPDDSSTGKIMVEYRELARHN
jgi:hypothetical protein